ncbi:MAG: hypothetical protein CFH05_01114, partial [Alphaproteobacteria bacterium MarineAlpha3_Bin4]
MTLAGSIVPSNENNMGQGRKGTRGAVTAGHLETVRAAASRAIFVSKED